MDRSKGSLKKNLQKVSFGFSPYPYEVMKIDYVISRKTRVYRQKKPLYEIVFFHINLFATHVPISARKNDSLPTKSQIHSINHNKNLVMIWGSLRRCSYCSTAHSVFF